MLDASMDSVASSISKFLDGTITVEPKTQEALPNQVEHIILPNGDRYDGDTSEGRPHGQGLCVQAACVFVHCENVHS